MIKSRNIDWVNRDTQLVVNLVKHTIVNFAAKTGQLPSMSRRR